MKGIPLSETNFVHLKVTSRVRRDVEENLCTWPLAAATLGCFLTPSAHASQVEVNKQTGAQNAAAVGTGNAVFQDLDQGSYQNQLEIPGSCYYHPQSENPSCKSLIKMPSKVAQLLVQAMPFSKTLTKQHSKAIWLLITTAPKVSDRFYRFPSFIISLKPIFFCAELSAYEHQLSISLLLMSLLYWYYLVE